MSSTEEWFGILMVFEIAPDINGCAAAIILICAEGRINLDPLFPHLFAQSKTG